MGKWIRRILLFLSLAVFLFCAGVVAFVMRQYRASDQLYDEAEARFVRVSDAGDAGGAALLSVVEAAPEADDAQPPELPRVHMTAPIEVDFDALRAVNPDVVGWLYCEGTVIDYPVMQGEDNDLYLHHSYDGSYSVSGSIFVESMNRRDFADYNTIVYGHHMKNGSMFAGLKEWASQDYYEEHPVMWLLTPEQDYLVLLLAGYTTSAYSDTYAIFDAPGAELDDYLAEAMANSDFLSMSAPAEGGRYVVLSTCAYVFDNARYVLHGMLAAADSAAGLPLEKIGSD